MLKVYVKLVVSVILLGAYFWGVPKLISAYSDEAVFLGIFITIFLLPILWLIWMGVPKKKETNKEEIKN